MWAEQGTHHQLLDQRLPLCHHVLQLRNYLQVLWTALAVPELVFGPLQPEGERREQRAESRVAVNGVTSQSRHTLPSLLSARCWSIRDGSSNVKKKIKTPANPKDFLSTPITISHCGLLPQRHWIDMEASSSLVQYKTHSFIFEFSFYWFLIEPHRMGSLHMLRDPLLDPP